MVEIRFHSLGGQGAVTLINLLAQAGDLVGKRVQAFPFFGAERRGAPVKSYVRMDDRPIHLRSQIYRPDFLVVMSPSLLQAALEEGTKEGSVLLVNQREEEDDALSGLPFRTYALDATSIALDLGMVVEGMPVLNQVFLGAVSYVTELIPLEAVNEVIRRNIPPGRQEASMEAARRGFTSVREVAGAGKRESRERTAAS
ncbi:2-oxoacid:acceptor oxidoreductase family protein [Candidatus Solincola sp.]|nr:2-oxoacid:acceptor oxidoreductase family protein [Actinomycetota bacterium]MDI7253046.1 2-oxoacid:acceptor oxidoreductase family protein [Actinomycetota bacterium]